MGNIDWAFELGALVPSIGIGFLFWLVLRSIVRADKYQREAERQAEREYIAAHPEAARFVRTGQTANEEKRKDATTVK